MCKVESGWSVRNDVQHSKILTIYTCGPCSKTLEGKIKDQQEAVLEIFNDKSLYDAALKQYELACALCRLDSKGQCETLVCNWNDTHKYNQMIGEINPGVLYMHFWRKFDSCHSTKHQIFRDVHKQMMQDEVDE